MMKNETVVLLPRRWLRIDATFRSFIIVVIVLWC